MSSQRCAVFFAFLISMIAVDVRADDSQSRQEQAIALLRSLGARVEREGSQDQDISVYFQDAWRGSDGDVSNLKDIRGLKIVLMSSPQLTAAAVIHLEKLPRLRHLSVRGNLTNDETLKHIGKCKCLESLLIAKGRCTDKGISELAGLRRLEELVIFENPITGTGFVKLGELKQLKLLSIRTSGFRDENMRFLGQLPSLETLNLVDADVTDRGLHSLRELQKLDSLCLDSTKISNEGLEYISTILPNLRNISLAHTAVTDDGMRHLAAFKKLSTVDITETSATPDCAVRYVAKDCFVWYAPGVAKIAIGDIPIMLDTTKDPRGNASQH